MFIESEATLVICSEPEAVAAKITTLKSIVGYLLKDEGIRMIRDVYFDTPADHALRNRKLALRIRQINSDTLRITFKGPSYPSSDSNTQRRQEVEEEWSKQGLQKITSRLKEENISLLEKPLYYEANYYIQEINHAINTIKQMGLEEIVQDRTMKRIVRNVIPLNSHSQENNTEILAELTIDSVTYCFENNKVMLYEVEVEAKEDKASNIPNVLSSALIAIFGTNVLRRWQYSKIATGIAIRELLKKKLLKMQDQTDNYRLVNEDYDTLEQ
jgi:hypothetical protein